MEEWKTGPIDETRRDIADPGTWVGLTLGERDLLQRYVDKLEVGTFELHTHIPVGMGGMCGPSTFDRASRKMLQQLYPRRVDAAVCTDNEWTLIECKLGCAHYVLGQILCYAYWWRRDCPECPVVDLLVLTDKCQDDVGCVLAAHGVVLDEL